MFPMKRTPKNFIVDLNSTPYVQDLSPITVGSRKFQAYSAFVLGIISFGAGFIYLPIFTLVAIPFLAWAAFLLYSRYIISYHEHYAEIFSRTPWSEAQTDTLFYQNYDGVQVSTRDNTSPKKGVSPYNFTITLVHSEPHLNLPLLDLADSNRAYSLSQLYGNLMGLPVLQSRLSADKANTQHVLA